MSEITENEVKHLAQLARIELKPEEITSLQKDLSRILEYVDALKEVDTAGLPDISQVTGLKNIIRDDKVAVVDEDIRNRIIDAMPESEKGYLKVKAIFKD